MNKRPEPGMARAKIRFVTNRTTYDAGCQMSEEKAMILLRLFSTSEADLFKEMQRIVDERTKG